MYATVVGGFLLVLPFLVYAYSICPWPKCPPDDDSFISVYGFYAIEVVGPLTYFSALIGIIILWLAGIFGVGASLRNRVEKWSYSEKK